ncbi:MAG: CPBP family intramembrane metalloprotease [Candidatus Marsarchaeota archaeon]|jgi:membrane protease YdiL (CAAX protease family)|nr:CPBP family intramembrane metalloprotease [Candidatus Marsarchaeota archaeon]
MASKVPKKRASSKTKASRRSTNKKALRQKAKRITQIQEKGWIRYTFYLLFLASIVSIFFAPYLYTMGIISLNTANADSSIGLSLFFPLVVFSYLMAKGKNLKQIIVDLGLSRSAMNWRALGYGIIVFLAIVLLEFGIGAFETVTHIPLPTNVKALLGGLPAYFFAFAVIVAPIDEEILFRGFLVPRIGIILSALIFGILHFLSYASVSEFIAAFVFGLIAGYVFKRTKSLYATIIPHVLVNVLGILALLL